MPRMTRTYHPEFLAYQKMIVNHPNYMGMPEAIDKDGKIKWVTAGSSSLGEARKKWWEAQKASLLSRGVKLAIGNIVSFVKKIMLFKGMTLYLTFR